MKKNSGFTLIEVLIAMFVLALGLLGLAGLQARGLKNNVSAYNRGQATQLAYDMADRIRANVTDGENSASSTYDKDTLTAEATIQSGCHSTSGCTAAQLAQNDLYEWNQAITSTLPNGIGQIDFADKTVTIKPAVGTTPAVTASFTVGTITISWDDDRDGDRDSDDPSFQMSFQL